MLNVETELEFWVEHPSQLPRRVLREFHAYWAARHRGGRLPGQQHLDPFDFPERLPHLMLVDVVGRSGHENFRVRVMGQHHIDVAGCNLAGEYLDTALQLDGEEVVARYRGVVAHRAPHYWRHRFLVYKLKNFSYERVAFPLARDGATVDTILSVLEPCYSKNLLRVYNRVLRDDMRHARARVSEGL